MEEAQGLPLPSHANEPAVGGGFQTDRVLTLVGGHIVHDTFTGFLSPMLPVLIQKLTLSMTTAGLLMTFLQGPSLLQPFFGDLADRMNLKWVVICAPALSAAAMSLLGVAPNYAILALLITIAGLSAAAFHSVAPVIVGSLSGHNMGRGMGLWMLGAELGRMIGPLLVVGAIQILTLPRTPWLMTLGFVGSLMLYVRLKDVPVRPPNANAPKLNWGSSLREMSPILAPLAAVAIARSFVPAAIVTFVTTYLREQGASLWFAGVALSVFEGSGAVGALVGGALSDRLGRREAIGLSMAGGALLMLAFLALTGNGLLVVLPLLGFVSLAASPALMAITQESFPKNRAFANGILLALTFTSRSSLALIIGILGDAFGLRTAYLVSAVVTLLFLPAVFRLPKRKTANA